MDPRRRVMVVPDGERIAGNMSQSFHDQLNLKVGDIVYPSHKPQQAGKIKAIIDRGFVEYKTADWEWMQLVPAIVIQTPNGLLRTCIGVTPLQSRVDELQKEIDAMKALQAASKEIDLDEYEPLTDDELKECEAL